MEQPAESFANFSYTLTERCTCPVAFPFGSDGELEQKPLFLCCQENKIVAVYTSGNQDQLAKRPYCRIGDGA
jgi:hypothetical protein